MDLVGVLTALQLLVEILFSHDKVFEPSFGFLLVLD